jgi:phage terminase large subunit-like protein
MVDKRRDPNAPWAFKKGNTMGAGRPKGSKNKATLEKERMEAEAREKAAEAEQRRIAKLKKAVAPTGPMTLDQVHEMLEEAIKLKSENKMAFFEPYPEQKRFCDVGATHRERLLMAGNQVGKSEIGAFEAMCHMTGQYPGNWKGKRFYKPTKGWCCGETSLLVRDVQQKKLCGEPGVQTAFGTGMIPKDCLLDVSMARGITDAYDTIQVKHTSEGVSVARFKSYEQGRQKHQGETLDWVWDDEEPPEDIYSEHLARLTGTGIAFVTFTPLKGRSKVVLRFLDDPSPDRIVITLPLSSVRHFSDEEKKRRVSGYAVHERDAREKGIPILGSGGVYQFAEEAIREAQIQFIPPHWVKLWGIDFGINHPFAAVLAAWDRDVDCVHILHTVRIADGLPLMHAKAMRDIAAAVPVAWPHDGHVRDKGSGDELASLYRKQGLSMLGEHATFETGGFSREAAILEITERALTGRFKVASHLSDWFSEFRLYHRKDGQIVKLEDDLMAATEKIIMAKRHARAVPLGAKVQKRRRNMVADGVDSSYFGFD